MNEDTIHDSNDEDSLNAVGMLGALLFSDLGTPPTSELIASNITEELDADTQPLAGDKKLLCLVTEPGMMNNVALQASRIGPSMTNILLRNNHSGTREISVRDNHFHYSTPNECLHSTTVPPSTGGSPLMQMTNYCSPSLPVMKCTSESTTSIPVGKNCLEAKQINLYCYYSNYYMTNQHSTTIPPSTGESQSMQVINYCSPSSAVMNHTRESTSHQNTNSCPPQFQSSQKMQRWHLSTIQPNINDITQSQQFSSESYDIVHKLQYGTLIRDLITTLPRSSSTVVKSSSLSTVASRDQELQNISNFCRREPGKGRVIVIQATSSESIDSMNQQNPNIVENTIKHDTIQGNQLSVRQETINDQNVLNTCKKEFQCSTCKKKFMWYSLWKMHYSRTPCNGKLFQCDMRPSKFTWNHYFENHHCTVASSDQQLQSTEDLYRFEPETSLITGIQASAFKSINSMDQENTNSVENSTRNSVIPSNRSLVRQQGPEQPNMLNMCKKKVQCRKCKEIFETYLDLNKHCCDGRPHKCDLCPSKFRYKRNLDVHRLTHLDEKPFTCNECQRTFNRQDTLKTHYLIHTGEKPFGCVLCHKKFRHKCALNKHRCQPTSNTGEKLFKCAFSMP